MSLATLRRPTMALTALLAWLAVLVQLVLTTRLVLADGRTVIDGVITTFSYFTVLTNLLVALVATAAAGRRAWDGLFTRPSVMSATAIYIFVVGLIYVLVLERTWNPTGLQLAADIVLHKVVPVLYVIAWLLFVPKGMLQWRHPIQWLLYPAVYAAYTMMRGEITGRYPYPFSDVGALGLPRVLVNTAVIFVLFFVLGAIVVAIDHRLGQLRDQSRVAAPG